MDRNDGQSQAAADARRAVDAQPAPARDRSLAQWRRVRDESMHERVSPISAVAGAVFAALAIAHPWFLPSNIAWIMVWIAAATSALAMGVWLWYVLSPPPLGLGNGRLAVVRA
jgi:hypothetical protein